MRDFVSPRTLAPRGLRELPRRRGTDRVREAYGSDKYNRLRALKQKWTGNFFRLNQNIAPN